MPIQTFLAACALAAGCTTPWQALPSFAWPDGDPSLQGARRAACVADGSCAPAARRTAAVDAAPAALATDLPPSAAARVDGTPADDGAASGDRSARPLGSLLLAGLGAALFVGWRSRGARDH